MSSKVRVQKIIAKAGLCSRREAEEWVREGLVSINGKVAKLGDHAELDDAIKVKGKLLHWQEDEAYFLVYKPRGVISIMTEDAEGRTTLKDVVKRVKERIFPVDRLEYLAEGVLLLTNDGKFAFDLIENMDVVCRYRIKVDRRPSNEDIDRLRRGGRVEGKAIVPEAVAIIETYQKNALIEFAIRGMHALDLKKFLENKGFHAEKITRYAIGHLTISGSGPGTVKKLEKSQVLALLKQPELGVRQMTQDHAKIRPRDIAEKKELKGKRTEKKKVKSRAKIATVRTPKTAARGKAVKLSMK